MPRAVLIYPGDATPDDRLILHSGVQLDIRALPLTGSLDSFRAVCQGFVARLVAEMESDLFPV